MRKLDWKALGQFVAVLMDMFGLIRGTLARVNVGIEIIPWLITDGKDSFIKALEELAENFSTTQRVRVINETTLEVNLDVHPARLSPGCSVEKHLGGGWVKVEKRTDGLYVSGRKVMLYTPSPQDESLSIRLVAERISKTKTVLNANIFYALEEHDLLPEDWKKLYSEVAMAVTGILFVGTVFHCDPFLKDPDSVEGWFVMCSYWTGGMWGGNNHQDISQLCHKRRVIAFLAD